MSTFGVQGYTASTRPVVSERQKEMPKVLLMPPRRVEQEDCNAIRRSVLVPFVFASSVPSLTPSVLDPKHSESELQTPNPRC